MCFYNDEENPPLWKMKFHFLLSRKGKWKENCFIFLKNHHRKCWKNIYLANQFLFSFLLCYLRFNVLHFSWHFIGATMAAFVSHFPFSQIVIESGAHFMFCSLFFFLSYADSLLLRFYFMFFIFFDGKNCWSMRMSYHGKISYYFVVCDFIILFD